MFFDTDGQTNTAEAVVHFVTRTPEKMEKMQQDLEHIEPKVRFYNGIKKAIEEDKPWPRFEDYSL